MTSLEISANIKYVTGLENDPNLATVIFNGTTAPNISSSSFQNIAQNATAYVPTGRRGTQTGMYNPNNYPFVNGSPLQLMEI